MEENLSVDFDLLEHQIPADENIDNIYSENGLNRRVAGAKMPTGAGKSFVAMKQILKAGGNDYKNKTNDGIINTAKIIYIAPTNEILFQTKRNIAKYI